MNDVNYELGFNIRRIRKARRIRQIDFADRYCELTGESLSPTMVSMWENGKRRIYADQLWIIASVLSVDPKMLFPKIPPGKFSDLKKTEEL